MISCAKLQKIIQREAGEYHLGIYGFSFEKVPIRKENMDSKLKKTLKI